MRAFSQAIAPVVRRYSSQTAPSACSRLAHEANSLAALAFLVAPLIWKFIAI
jgi:hypothetical protein